MLKKYAMALAAWNLSSYVTIYQMAVAKAAAPQTYDWIMDLASGPAGYSWDLAVAAWEVCWDFLSAS